MRDLLVITKQDLFPHDLADHEPRGLVRDDVVGKERFPLGQIFNDEFFEFGQIFAPARRNGHDVAPDPPFEERFCVGGDLLFGHDVRLCVCDDHRYAERKIMFHQGNVRLRDPFVPVVHEQDKVDVLCGRLRRPHHHRRERVARFIDAGRVRKYDLRALFVEDAEDAVARGLGFGGYDGDFFADEHVHERAFSCICFADDGDRSALHCASLPMPMAFITCSSRARMIVLSSSVSWS